MEVLIQDSFKICKFLQKKFPYETNDNQVMPRVSSKIVHRAQGMRESFDENLLYFMELTDANPAFQKYVKYKWSTI